MSCDASCDHSHMSFHCPRKIDKKKSKIFQSKYTITMLSTKDLVFKEKPVKKLMERYMRPYVVKKVVLRDIVELKLLASMKIHLMVNVSRIVKYRELVKGQRVEEPKPVEVDRVEKWEVENNIWEKEKDLENVKALVKKFKERMEAEVG